MADRFSEPSNSLGVHRFHCWPLGADSYDHVELTADWDKADAMVGVPSAGTAWPPTEGIDGGIYREVRLLQVERQPVGSMQYWFRPSLSVPLTVITDAGWAVADGSVIVDHDFPGVAGNVTLPNLLNTYAIGADSTKTIGAAGVAVGDPHIDDSQGAPGPQGSVGSNQNTLTTAQMPSHDHGTGGSHTHSGSTGPAAATVSVWWNLFGPGTGSSLKLQASTEGGGGASTGIDSGSHSHTVSISSGGSHAHAATGGGTPHENRPRAIGLIPIIKVKYVDTI